MIAGELKEWIIEFIKNKDIFAKSIQSIENTKKYPNFFVVKFKDKEVLFLVLEKLSDYNSHLDKSKFISIATNNSKDNFNTLISDWHKFTEYENLTIYFINSSSKNEKKWIIRPHLHNKIADDESLKTGLLSMFETVEIVN